MILYHRSHLVIIIKIQTLTCSHQCNNQKKNIFIRFLKEKLFLNYDLCLDELIKLLIKYYKMIHNQKNKHQQLSWIMYVYLSILIFSFFKVDFCKLLSGYEVSKIISMILSIKIYTLFLNDSYLNEKSHNAIILLQYNYTSIYISKISIINTFLKNV